MRSIRKKTNILCECIHRVLVVAGLVLFSSQSLPAEEIRILDGDGDAFLARLQLIHQAERDIAIACHDSDSGQVVRHLAKAMSTRVQQGVRVRLLVDGLLSRRSYEQLNWLAGQGIDVKVFHPTGSMRLSWLNRRLHSKIMVCDESSMILGSRNLTDPHFGLDCERFIDADYLVSGPLSSCGKRYFDWLWSYAGALPIQQAIELQRNRKTPLRNEDVQETAPWQWSNVRAELQLPLPVWPSEVFPLDEQSSTLNPSAGQMHSQSDFHSIPSNQLKLVFDRDFEKNNFSFEAAVLEDIDRARCSITIETPYPAFSEKFKRSIARAARRGVSVTLLTNSINSSDQLTTISALLNQKRAILRSGVEIREYRGPGLVHAKSLIVDRAILWTGSYNFDPRGDRLNLELCLRVTNRAFIQSVEASILQRNATSARIDLADLGRLDPNLPLKTRMKVRTYQLLMPVLRPSL